MNKIKIILGILTMAFITSCTINRSARLSAPVNVQVIVNYDNLDYVGEVTGTASQNFVLGLPIGGKRWRYVNTAVAGSTGFLPNNRGVNNALYDALSQKPDADFVIPFNVDEKRNLMFLGSKRTYTVKAKAFKLKAK
ncbi:MAG: hypothetical protein IPO27_12120 [Bacteroidetes bacterium]|nr:hypothetical protein [Bacteroidota bacterium]